MTKVRRQREQGRNKRGKSGIATVALVGYTNAGKSTLFNRLTDEKVYAADQLFATLDPTLRRLDLPGGTATVLADTVGFIRDLPHELVDAFRSTLTETLESDLILHVIDDSDDERDQRVADVNRVLSGIGAAQVPQFLVFNKIDRSGHAPKIELAENGEPASAWVSALKNDGLDGLLEAIAIRVSGGWTEGWLRVTPAQGKLRAQLFAANAIIEEHQLEDGSVDIRLAMDKSDYERLAREHRINKLSPVVGELAASSRA